jgi:hypothetical protein
LKVQPKVTGETTRTLAQIGANVFKKMGYEIKIHRDTGYLFAYRPISRFFAGYEMKVWIKPGSEGHKHLKVICKGRGCLNCQEQEEVALFLTTFDKLLAARGLSGAVETPQVGSLARPPDSGEMMPPTKRPSKHQKAFVPQHPMSKEQAVLGEDGFHKITVTPAKVSPGEAFDLRIEYTVVDGTVDTELLPVKLSYRISDGEKVFLSKPIDATCPNGKRTTEVLNLTAAKREGTYTIEGLLNYKDEIWKQSVHLNVD